MVPRLTTLILFVISTMTIFAAEPVVIGQKYSIQSKVLGERRTYSVYLPESYAWAGELRYPVLYVLDGQSHFGHTVGSVRHLATNGEIPEMIVVAIDSTIRVRDFTQTDWATAWVGGGGADNFRRFLSTELLPAIQRSYRTDGFRILSGHSAGGQFVLYCITAEPSLFRAYLAISPSLEWDGNLPQRSLDEFLKTTPALNAFLYVARSDDSGRALADYEQLVDTLEATSPQGFRWHSQPFPDETHSGVPLLAQIDALRRLYAGYLLHGDLMGRGLAHAEQHFENVSKTVGWPLPVPERVINDLGYSALNEGKAEDAIALFRRNVQSNPKSANALDSLADAYAATGNWQQAAGVLERAVALATRYDHPNRSYFAEQLKKAREQVEKANASKE